MAYVDPGSGTLILQMLSAGALWAVFRLRKHMPSLRSLLPERVRHARVKEGIARLGFRDPEGMVFRHEGRILRWVSEGQRAVVDRLGSEARFQTFRDQGLLVEGRVLAAEEVPEGLREGITEDEGFWLEHPPVTFPTYPEEWTWRMLQRAALLTLDLAEAALDHGMELKDATPHNVFFVGNRPIFVDLLSFHVHEPSSVLWRAEKEFVCTFLLPLALHQDLGLRLSRSFLGAREGISLEEAHRLAGPLRAWRSPYRRWVTLPILLSRFSLDLGLREVTAVRALGLCRRRIRMLRTAILRLSPPAARGAMAGYRQATPYSEAQLEEKQHWIRQVLGDLPGPGRVLDLGANDGAYSRMAVERGHDVVALEADPEVLDRLVPESSGHVDPRLMPVVMNLANPTPAQGWAGQEQEAFLARAEGRFDLVLCLALVHHLRFTEAVPFRLQMEILARLTRRWAVVEWITPEDPQTLELAVRFGYWPDDFAEEDFLEAIERHFRVLRRQEVVPGRRHLFLLERR